MYKQNQGLTIIELMIVVVIGTILITVGIPSFQRVIERNRILSISSDLTAALNLARSEAVKRSSPMTVCAANSNQTSCAGASDWDNGWIVFVDPDGNGSIANANDRLKVHGALTGNANINTTQARVTYDASGFVTAGGGNSGTYTIFVTGCTGDSARLVDISNTGRVSLSNVACPS